MLKNNKGFIAAAVFGIMAFTSVGLAGILLRPQHIINRATQKCVATTHQSESDCRITVSQMTQDQRIETIRDK